MRKRRLLFLTFTILLCVLMFVQSCFSNSRVQNSLGLANIFENISAKKGGSFDSNNYNEAVAVAYLKAVYDKNAYDITPEEAEKEFDNIFDKKNGVYVSKHIGTIIENNNIEREIRRKLDHNFYGEISTLADIKSNGFYISQNNKKYTEIAYSASNMYVHGCGPISLSMALNILSDKSVYDAETLALWAKNNGYMDKNAGTVWAFINDYAEEQGFDVEETALGESELKQYFAEGAVIITCMGKGTFTDDGHFVVLSGLDSENNVRVLDSVSIYRTNKNWPISQILDESKGTFWVIKR